MKYGYVDTNGEINVKHISPDVHPSDEYDGAKRSAFWNDEDFQNNLKEIQRRFSSDKKAS